MPDVEFSSVEFMELNAEVLERLFGKEENYGTVEECTGDGALWPDGTRWSTCTNWAHYCARVLGKRAQTLGFFDDDNPDSAVASDYGGHDFSLVDGRWIVDGWLREVACMSNRIVFDLENPDDAADIAKFYGDRNTWEESGDDPSQEDPSLREVALSSSLFSQIIAELQAPRPRL